MTSVAFRALLAIQPARVLFLVAFNKFSARVSVGGFGGISSSFHKIHSVAPLASPPISFVFKSLIFVFSSSLQGSYTGRIEGCLKKGLLLLLVSNTGCQSDVPTRRVRGMTNSMTPWPLSKSSARLLAHADFRWYPGCARWR